MVFNRGEVGVEAMYISIVDRKSRSTISGMVQDGAITSCWCIPPRTSVRVIRGPGDIYLLLPSFLFCFCQGFFVNAIVI